MKDFLLSSLIIFTQSDGSFVISYTISKSEIPIRPVLVFNLT